VARAALGDEPLVVPEQMVSLETDPTKAREIARLAMSIYLNLPNYTYNLRRLGYGDDDLAPPGSDRLVDAIVAWGAPSVIASQVQAHFDAGANEVCLQVVGTDPGTTPIAAWRELATIVG
jgi:probable F420-dependent oxidoreductase